MQATRSLSAVAQLHPTTFVRYHKGLTALLSAQSPKRDLSQDVNVLVLWGPSGTGKSKLAYTLAEQMHPNNYYVKPAFNTWWDGYNGEKCVILDDFCGQWPITYTLLVLDRYPLKVEFKGGSTELLANNFIITSNYHPQDWYINGTINNSYATAAREHHINALLRRCNNIVHSDDMMEQYEQHVQQPASINLNSNSNGNGSQQDPIEL